MYVPALNKPLDLNSDCIPDVTFVQATPANPAPGVTYVNVSATVGGVPNPEQLTNGTYGEITWLKDAPREWDDKRYYYPIPESALLKNPALGQNPGW